MRMPNMIDNFTKQTDHLAKMLRTCTLAVSLCVGLIVPVQAQQVHLIQDAEIEAMLREMVTPLLRAAGLASANPTINIVADRRFNAFVVESGDIFVNYGTILDAQSPNALKAVFAHEIAHLAGGHLASIRERADVTARVQVIAMALGVGAMVAGSAAGVESIGGMGSAFILASQSAGVNALMAFRRTEESAADITGVRLLEQTGASTKGMIDILTLLSDTNAIVANASPYLRSHPQPRDRLNAITDLARAASTWANSDNAADVLQFELAQAKITGYLEAQRTTLDRYPNSDRSLPARYARIITAYNAGAAISAVQQMPTLISMAPNNPYFHELQGQMLLEIGRPAEALPPIERALQLATGQYLIRQLYGHALLETGTVQNVQESIVQLSRVAREAPNAVLAQILLSRAHSALGHTGEADLAAAEAALARGQISTALGLARQAQQNLIENSPAWLRADDILSMNR